MELKIGMLMVMILLLPSQYDMNQCELIGKDVQREHGGNLVFIQPLKESGAYNFGAFNGHWINAKVIHGEKYYIDYGEQRIFRSKLQVMNWYKSCTGQNSEMYEIGIDSVPFGIIYHYG